MEMTLECCWLLFLLTWYYCTCVLGLISPGRTNVLISNVKKKNLISLLSILKRHVLVLEKQLTSQIRVAFFSKYYYKYLCGEINFEGF